MSRLSARTALLAALALCAACQVGDPLVDRLAPPQFGGIHSSACDMPKPCDEAPMLALEPSEPKPMRWHGCPVDCAGSASEATSGGSLTLDCVSLDPLHDLAADLSCVTRRFTATAPALAARADVIVAEVRWKSSNIIIEAEDPLEIVFSEAELHDTRVDLAGPITLRFQDQTSLKGVTISSASESARVVFDRVEPFDLVVGDAKQPFAGHMEAQHSVFSVASAVIDSAELDSAEIEDAFVSARTLVANDGALSRVTLDVDHATFAPAVLRSVAFTQCQTLSFFGSDLKNVHVPRCSGEPTRVYATKVVESRIDGRVSGDSSMFEAVHLGVDEPSELELWGVVVKESTFCDRIESFKVSDNAVECSACSELAFDRPDKGCLLPFGGFEDLSSVVDAENGAAPRGNFCDALDMLERCPPPFPTRTRPIGELD